MSDPPEAGTDDGTMRVAAQGARAADAWLVTTVNKRVLEKRVGPTGAI